MKLKLLVTLSAITFYGYSQTPIENYESTTGSNYAIVTGTLNQTATGSTSWDFTVASSGETTQDVVEAVTTGSTTELDFPGTTSVLITSASIDPPGEAKVYTKKAVNDVFLTGLESSGLTLNYSDNGFLGTFPLDTGNGDDTVSGTFNFDGQSGTFSGTITTLVDAYGTLSVNDVGSGAYSGEVTRLKIDQSLALSVSGFPVGNVVQSAYFYYDAENADLALRYSQIEISSIAGNQSSELIEVLLQSSLSVSDNSISKEDVSVFPNPVKNHLTFQSNNDIVIYSIALFDISGREVVKSVSNSKSIPVSRLGAGIYIATINTNKGSISRKFIKE